MEGIHSPRRFWQMGHRTMDTPNLGGRTVPRHHVPKRARRSRKRTLRATTKTPRPVKPAEQTQPKQVPQIAAKTQEPLKPAASAQRPEQDIVGDKGKRVPLDYLQDGAIEWGIKREGEEGSGT